MHPHTLSATKSCLDSTEYLHVTIIVQFSVVYNHLMFSQIKFSNIVPSLHVEYFCPNISLQIWQLYKGLLHDSLKYDNVWCLLRSVSVICSRILISANGIIEMNLHHRRPDCSCLQPQRVVWLSAMCHQSCVHSFLLETVKFPLHNHHDYS